MQVVEVVVVRILDLDLVDLETLVLVQVQVLPNLLVEVLNLQH
jgi:hypothetical protein